MPAGSSFDRAAVDKLMRHVTQLQRDVRTLSTRPRLANSSVDGGALQVNDEEGNLRVTIGAQDDGTFTVQDVGGAPPPKPSAPLVAPMPGGVTISWDGNDLNGVDIVAAGSPWPTTLGYVSVRMATVPGEPGVEVARMTASLSDQYGGSVTVAQPSDVTTYVTFVAVLRSGVESPASDEVEAVGGTYVDPVDLDPLNEALTALQTDLSAAQDALTELNTATLPGLADDVDAAQAAVTEVTGTIIPGLQTDLGALQAALDDAFPITTTQITDDAITTAKIAANAVTATEILSHTITALQIAADTITANEIAADSITASEIAANTITAAEIAADTITAAQIAANAITASEIAADAVTATKIAADAVTANKIAADAVLARNIKAGEIETIHLSAGAVKAENIDVAVLTSGFTITGKIQVGTHTWTPNEGLIIPGVVTLPGLAGGTAEFTGNVTAKAITVQKDFNLLGNTNQIKGTLTLSNGVVRPTTAPTVFQSWPLIGSRAMPFGPTDYGLAPHLSNANLLVSAVAFFGGGVVGINKNDGTGVPLYSGNKAWGSGFNPTGGITTFGGAYYVLGFDTNRSNGWYIYQLNATLDKVAEIFVATTTDLPGRPALGNDGTSLLIGYADGANILRVSRWHPTTGVWQGNTDASFPGIGATNISWIGQSTYDFGAVRQVIVLEGNANFVTTGAGVRTDSNIFFAANGGQVRGLHWDGTRFLSYNTDGALYKHGTNPTQQAITASYTWYDGNATGGTHETEDSPPVSFTQGARTWLNITTSEAPDSGNTDTLLTDKANRVGVYAGIGVGVTRGRQAYLGLDSESRTIRTLSLETVLTGQPAAPTSNGFLGASNSPGIIKTYGAVLGPVPAGFILNGDGSGQWGSLLISAAGAVSRYDDTNWADITFVNGWVSYDATATPRKPQYRRRNGYVELRGVAKSGVSGALAFNLPTGFRPPARTPDEFIAAIVMNNAFGVFTANSLGDCYFTGSNAYAALDNIRIPLT